MTKKGPYVTEGFVTKHSGACDADVKAKELMTFTGKEEAVSQGLPG